MIEVCAGAGGLSTGFEKANFKPILLNEIDKTCCSTLRKNHPNVEISNIDMKNLDLKPYKNKIDVLLGGVPCQSFSLAGLRAGLEDPRGSLILEFNRLIKETEPKVFLVENVKGLLNHNNGETLKNIIELFSNNGKYNISYKILNAKNFQVPQKRERIFIVGTKSKKKFEFPQIINEEIFLRDVLKNVPPSLGLIYTPEKKAIMNLIPQGGCWVNLPENLQRTYLGSSYESSGGKRGFARRLSMNEQCLTLTTSPNQKQTERCHPTETRPLTVREYARIQTFPDSYIFEGSVYQQYKQIGNAVPVNLAYHMALSIKKYLESIARF